MVRFNDRVTRSAFNTDPGQIWDLIAAETGQADWTLAEAWRINDYLAEATHTVGKSVENISKHYK